MLLFGNLFKCGPGHRKARCRFLLYKVSQSLRRKHNLPDCFSILLVPLLPPPWLPVVGSEADRVTPTPPFFLIPGTPQWDPSSGGGGMHARTHTKRHLVIPHLYTHNMCISHYHSLLVLLFTHTHASWPPLWAPSSFAASSGSRCGSSRICEKILSVCFSLFTVIK